MAPDARRRAIVEVVVPLLLEHGPEVTTRQIAEAAGIAEGTIFRVFPDKPALLVAAAEQTMDPQLELTELRDAVEECTELRSTILRAAEHLFERSVRVTAVMMALRGVWLAQRDGHEHRPGPPPFLVEANRALLEGLTELFEPHRDELTVEPRTAGLLLRTLVLGSRHPGAAVGVELTPRDVADVLLDGIRRHEGRCCR
jgi:AcrR family transcriptional regulator